MSDYQKKTLTIKSSDCWERCGFAQEFWWQSRSKHFDRRARTFRCDHGDMTANLTVIRRMTFCFFKIAGFESETLKNLTCSFRVIRLMEPRLRSRWSWENLTGKNGQESIREYNSRKVVMSAESECFFKAHSTQDYTMKAPGKPSTSVVVFFFFHLENWKSRVRKARVSHRSLSSCNFSH